eukprot:364243-Chlamydomonas_euryale.AAC.10
MQKLMPSRKKPKIKQGTCPHPRKARACRYRRMPQCMHARLAHKASSPFPRIYQQSKARACCRAPTL